VIDLRSTSIKGGALEGTGVGVGGSGVGVERYPFDVDIIAKMHQAVALFEAEAA
jgi:hypothetical protein